MSKVSPRRTLLKLTIFLIIATSALRHFLVASETQQIGGERDSSRGQVQYQPVESAEGREIREPVELNQVPEKPDSGRQQSHQAHGIAHTWSYDGPTGPEHWGDLAPEFRLAKEGREQSPIDLRDSIYSTDLKPLEFRYGLCPLEILNNGHTIQVNVPSGNTLKVGNKVYKLLQLHFHTESEHTVNGAHFPLEVHFVHKDAQGNYGVVGVLVKEGAHNSALEKIWEHMPAREQAGVVIPEVTLSPADLLPNELSYYSYSGSLTTPPCSEHVSWFVEVEPIEASSDQIKRFSAIFPHNNRPTQSLFGRVVRRSP